MALWRHSARACSLLLFLRGAAGLRTIPLSPKWPADFPFKAQDFQRGDETPDTSFYSVPRLVFHIDDDAVNAVTEHYLATIPRDAQVLDICSSWVSHLPPAKELPLKRVVGLGMNEEELKQNPRLDEYVVRDLNVNPTLPFKENDFDVVTCVVSVDYLTSPLEVFREIQRVLKPGGRAIMSISNRCFPTKAIRIWLQTDDLEHIFIVSSYFHYAGGIDPLIEKYKCSYQGLDPRGFDESEAIDRSPNPGKSDPLYIVQAQKAVNQEL